MKKRKKEKIDELKSLIIEFGRGDVSEERANEIAIHYYTYKKTLAEKIEDCFFSHMSLTQLANNFAIAERIRKEDMQRHGNKNSAGMSFNNIVEKN